ncbi:MAG TPA: hypothetical protein VGG75_37970 [Trebonia sp.]
MTTPAPGITVVTSTGNTYSVPSGLSFDGKETMTGELAVTVFADPAQPPVAAFGSVETVYQDGTVTLMAPLASRGL